MSFSLAITFGYRGFGFSNSKLGLRLALGFITLDYTVPGFDHLIVMVGAKAEKFLIVAKAASEFLKEHKAAAQVITDMRETINDQITEDNKDVVLGTMNGLTNTLALHLQRLDAAVEFAKEEIVAGDII
jgi:hypothetical protein